MPGVIVLDTKLLTVQRDTRMLSLRKSANAVFWLKLCAKSSMAQSLFSQNLASVVYYRRITIYPFCLLVFMISSKRLNNCIVAVVALVLTSYLCFFSLAHAQIEVIDRTQTPAAKQQESRAQSRQSADLYYQMQIMEQELLQLRGLIEQQSNEIKKLKQQHLEDYMDLDRRMLGQTAPATTAKPLLGTVGSPIAENDEPVVPLAEPRDPKAELTQYRAAIDLVLKEKDFEQAKARLQQHLVDFPNGRYAANAHYWLGEIALEQDNNKDAEKWFSNLLKTFPEHSKSDDARYKLGEVYLRNGDKARAKAIMIDLEKKDKGVSELAKRFLDKHFPEY